MSIAPDYATRMVSGFRVMIRYVAWRSTKSPPRKETGYNGYEGLSSEYLQEGR